MVCQLKMPAHKMPKHKMPAQVAGRPAPHLCCPAPVVTKNGRCRARFSAFLLTEVAIGVNPQPRFRSSTSVGRAVFTHGGVAWNQLPKVKVMDICPQRSNLSAMGHSRVAIRKAFAFCGWSIMCGAVGFALVGEQWARGIASILSLTDFVSGISAENLSTLEICFAGMLVSAIFAVGFFIQGCIQFAMERYAESQAARKVIC